MLSLSSRQLCDFYLDGNLEAAFEVFEYGGPAGLRQFLGIEDEAVWKQTYCVLLDDYGFLLQLCQKYRPYLSQLIRDQGLQVFRELLRIESFEYDEVWQRAVLDELLESYMHGVFHQRQRSQIGVFFSGLRNTLRRQLGL